MICVPTNDREYHEWLTKNSKGFVINSDKALKSRAYPMIHKASCDHINDPATPNYTTKHFLKLCALDSGELREWLHEIDKRELKVCKSCAPHS
jgi:hypothetical protein